MISSLRLAAHKSAVKCAAASFSSTTAASAGMKNVVVVAGTRIPFATTTSIYMDELAVDLQRLAISGLLTQTALPKDAVDYVIAGSVGGFIFKKYQVIFESNTKYPSSSSSQ